MDHLKQKRGTKSWLFLFGLLLTLSVQMTHAQTASIKKISGVVYDEYNDPIIGANVVQKGKLSNGTITGIDGSFSLSIAADATIIVSYIGYETQEVALHNKTKLTVVLKEDAETLSEVVVTALGMTRDKKALGYAMTELKGDELLKSNIVNPVNALQGKVAGVQINMGAAGPQSSQRILIRGNTSMSGNNQPIFVVDGIIIDNEVTKTGGKFDRDFGNDLKNLNSDDFEKVSVLKGAAATALYGSRASNGVILITTKKGRKGEGLGISFSHTRQWEGIYAFPHLQNEFGMGANPVWALKDDGTEDRNLGDAGRNFGPRYDYKPYTIKNTFEAIHQPYPDNLKEMYQTGHYRNTNIALSGGNEKSTFRFSFSNLENDGISLRNSLSRNSLSLNATHEISKYVKAEAGYAYVHSTGKNPTYQGGDMSPVYDFSFSVPRDYDTKYWMKNYWSETKDGFNGDDPFGYSRTLFDYMENDEIQDEDNYRGYLNLNFNLTEWLQLSVKGDMNRLYRKNERKTLATERDKFRGSMYALMESQKQQYKINSMLVATKKFEDFSLIGSLGIERFHEDQSFHFSFTNNGLRVPGLFELSNSVDPATTAARSVFRQKRINSAYGFINADWKGQLFLDITGRNDWSSTLRYVEGTGNVSYFYPSASASWLLNETFRGQLPEMISFLKLRASYAIVGKDSDPYMITDPGTYVLENAFKDSHFGSGTHAYYRFANGHLGAPDLKPEKQHAVEFGLDFRMFNNRFGVDLAYYKTNTKNQILALPTSSEAGVTHRIINAGNIQNAGLELLLTGTPIKTKDLMWDLTLTFTRNRNKIISLYPGVTKYKLGTTYIETDVWATEGGAYGDIYSSTAYKRDEQGNRLLNASGAWIRSGESKKIGSIQPNFLSGLTSSLQWRNLSFTFVLDARFGGDILSGSYNYGMSSGRLKSSLQGRTEELGGLPRKMLKDDRIVNDGMIPDGIFEPGVEVDVEGKKVAVGGMSYQQAYDKGYVKPLSAYQYYGNTFDWGTGIREASIHQLSWIALREISLYWTIPSQWLNKAYIKGGNIGFVVRNVGYLYNSMPDNIHPEGLKSNYSYEYVEAGGNVFSRNYGIKLNLNF